jgi:primosomal protein N' (replication factor Y)
VTGSGKTEVYIRAMQATLKSGKSALMLVPEISLTPMFSRRLEEHFGDEVAILHSALSDGERLDEWNRIRLGDARVVIGTRSAVFAPLQNLGLVVVDEEHETSYKQDETPRYHGRDTAIMRALKADAVVILGSATPSIESYHNAHQEKYTYCRMAERIGVRGLADVEIVDMREVFKRHGKQQFISDELKQGLFDTRSRGQQAMVLLNRRGFSAFLLCRSCGNAVQCPNCDVTLTYHRNAQRLVCHYCNHQRGIPPKCPVCDGEFIYYVGEGTEQLEAVIKEAYPAMTVARLDRDTTRKRGAYEKIISEFASGQIDVLVGTQMIAKGHDFPNVTLVGVVSVDAGLAMPDFRAAERTFQLLTQVAGRAGRGDIKGRVLIQTYHPLHYALQHACKQDYEGFYQEEIQFRRSMFYPPFTALINVLVRNADYGKAQGMAAEMARLIRNASDDRYLRILGPAPAPLTRLRGEYRMQVLIKGPNRSSVRRTLDIAMQTAIAAGHDMKQVMVEVDPINLM